MEGSDRKRVQEAPLERTENGLEPTGEGWFVINATEAPWLAAEGRGRACLFEGAATRFGEFGLNVHVLAPGEPNAMYHGENAQEGFLVVSGECLLLIEGEERRMRAWDYAHFPPWTRHVVIGAGSEPAVVVMVGTRKQPEEIDYPVEPAAQRHGAGVEVATSDQRQAYASVAQTEIEPYSPGTLPGG